MSAKPLMIQGTMSNSGKSFVAAAFCRILTEDGYLTAPFKSQNMALNSYITINGLEMGRAQVMQAEAAKIEPSIEMNPILLKPTSTMGSQVIVNGEVYETMKAMDYYKNKKQFIPHVKAAYQTLAEKYDRIVLEGAGSPAEINLKENDIVNMGMAKLAKAPVLLVADIDRGGVFASIYGTICLLDDDERKYVKGIIINKFRGDVKILEPGLKQIEELTGVPVVGVIPMVDIDLDDEDSLSDRLTVHERIAGMADIAVIRLPHISNFTDFSALDRIEFAHVRYVEKAEQLKEPDLIIIPGTKNTTDDLLWMRSSGMEAAIQKLREKQVPIIGICGGFQILGESCKDPMHVETGKTVRGLGMLPIETVFEKEKVRTRIHGKVIAKQNILLGKEALDINGYEIHMGNTIYHTKADPLIQLEDGRYDGCVSEDGFVMGSYLHGFFDNDIICGRIMDYLYKKNNINQKSNTFDMKAYKEAQYDKLADIVRASVNMDKIYQIIEEGM